MGATSVLPALAAFALALITAGLLARFVGPGTGPRRFATLDGLRGFLALSVFLHHVPFFYFYVTAGRFDGGPSHFYSHLGRASVLLFFMITAFLFTTKLLDARRGDLDWLRLVVSRLLRILPLYLVAIAALVLLAFQTSHWAAHDSPAVLAGQIGRWYAFLRPPINGVDQTRMIDCGVTWTLPYEWSFYFALPILGVLIGARTTIPYVLASVAALSAAFLFWPLEPFYGLAFLGGGIAAWLVRLEPVRRAVAGWPASLAAFGALALAVALYPTPNHGAAVAILSVFFCIVAGGNTLFGALTTPAARLLGQISYSVYLLHGTLLFLAFMVVIQPTAAGWSPLDHWAVALALVPVMVVLCLGSFLAIEQPGMALTGGATARLRRLGGVFAASGRPRKLTAG